MSAFNTSHIQIINKLKRFFFFLLGKYLSLEMQMFLQIIICQMTYANVCVKYVCPLDTRFKHDLTQRV